MLRPLNTILETELYKAVAINVFLDIGHISKRPSLFELKIDWLSQDISVQPAHLLKRLYNLKQNSIPKWLLLLMRLTLHPDIWTIF